MKKYTVFVLILALVLTCACSKKPVDPPVQDDPPVQQEQPATPPADPVTPPETSQAPEVPETPAPPVASETPEAPQTPEIPESPVAPEMPEEPQQPAEVEPEGAVAKMMLPSAIAHAERVRMALPLEGNVVVLQAVCDEQPRVLLYDMAESAVLAEETVADYGSGEQPPLSLLEKEPRTFLYFDGREYWKFTADQHWQLEKQPYDVMKENSIMGDSVVEERMTGIAVDGTVPEGLKSSPTEIRSLVRVLDDHRLLYAYLGASAMDRHVGIYDHDTGETRIVSSVGQRAWGIWGNTLILVRGGGPVYDLARVDLEDYSYTPLEIGHETVTDRVDVAICNADGTRLMVSWEDSDGAHVQVFDSKTGEELYQWSTPESGSWSFWPVDDNGLVACFGFEGGRLLWKVEY